MKMENNPRWRFLAEKSWMRDYEAFKKAGLVKDYAGVEAFEKKSDDVARTVFPSGHVHARLFRRCILTLTSGSRLHGCSLTRYSLTLTRSCGKWTIGKIQAHNKSHNHT